EGAKLEPARKARASRQTKVIDDDRDIVARIELDVARLVGHHFPFAHRRVSFYPRTSFPSPLVGEGGAKRRMRGSIRDLLRGERPLTRIASCDAIRPLPQGERSHLQ